MLDTDTIAAIATPPGKGGVGIIRLSGNKALTIATQICQRELTPRYAHFSSFQDAAATTIDHGVAIYFKAPASFTGEDVVELQGHGGPVIMDMLLQSCIDFGARVAEPGEFSKRAFLNDKIDLTQAEAIADLIDASSRQAATSALRSLNGDFSEQVDAVAQQLLTLRMYVESAIDFPEEEIDFLSDGHISNQLNIVINSVQTLLKEADQGAVLRDGIHISLAGAPNAGKSSLLNALAGVESAIVTDIAGTTRDVIRESVLIDGIPVHISDTAGLRDANDEVERIGIERSLSEVEKADLLLLVIDASQGDAAQQAQQLREQHQDLAQKPCVTVYNKCDLIGQQPYQGEHSVSLSAKTGAGIDLLRTAIKQHTQTNFSGESSFLARKRHIDALRQCLHFLHTGKEQLELHHAGELLAEDLSYAHKHLGQITGKVSADDLLGVIFSSFCIGK